eukprot:954980-Pyramimonas_sp.AAC.1
MGIMAPIFVLVCEGGVPSWAFRVPRRAFLELFWALLGASWSPFGPPLGPFGDFPRGGTIWES